MVKGAGWVNRLKLENNLNGMPLIGAYHLTVSAIGKTLLVICEYNFIKDFSCNVLTTGIGSFEKIAYWSPSIFI